MTDFRFWDRFVKHTIKASCCSAILVVLLGACTGNRAEFTLEAAQPDSDSANNDPSTVSVAPQGDVERVISQFGASAGEQPMVIQANPDEADDPEPLAAPEDSAETSSAATTPTSTSSQASVTIASVATGGESQQSTSTPEVEATSTSTASAGPEAAEVEAPGRSNSSRRPTSPRPTNRRPTSTQQTVTTQPPTTAQRVTTTQRSTTTQRATTTQQPTTTQRATTQRSTTTQRATTTQQPTTTQRATTQRSTTTQPATTTQQPTTTQRVTTTQQPTTTVRPSTTTTRPVSQPPRQVAFAGVSSSQWNEIGSTRGQFSDPNNCQARVGSIATAYSVVVNAGDSNALSQAVSSGTPVILLKGGTHSIGSTLKLESGQQLIGASGENVTINAQGVRRGVFLDNGAVLANVLVINAENEGVVLGSRSLVFQTSVGRTGYGRTSNENGAGISVTRNGVNNCVVSTEAYEGFNEDGAGCGPCDNGGNADGYAIKFGAKNNTLIDAHGFRNSDDGYDFWDGGSVFIYLSSAFDNGKTPDRASGDGNGFKLGRGQARHHIYKSKSYRNKADGFTLNGNSVSAVLKGTESYDNGRRNYADVGNS